MLPPISNFWSISRKESFEFQQNHALKIKFLWTLINSDDNFYPGHNRKLLIKKRTSFLDRNCFNYEQFFHTLQCTACNICQCSSIDKLGLPRATGFLSISGQFHYLWGTKSFGNSEKQYWDCLCRSWNLHILFFYQFLLCKFGKKNCFRNHCFQCLVIVAFQLQLVLVFWEYFWNCSYNMMKSQFWFWIKKEVSVPIL